MKKIAIVTVNFNGKKDTLEFLESLKLLKTVNCKLKTILVDNGSTDGGKNIATRMIMEFHPGMIWELMVNGRVPRVASFDSISVQRELTDQLQDFLNLTATERTLRVIALQQP
jgi:glycosyltransferase involved in cell wall biosynthesis